MVYIRVCCTSWPSSKAKVLVGWARAGEGEAALWGSDEGGWGQHALAEVSVGSNPPGTAKIEGQVKKYFFKKMSNFYV